MTTDTELDELDPKVTPFVKPGRAAAVLGVDIKTLRAALDAGQVPSVEVGQRRLVPTAWLRRAAGLEND